MTVTKKVSIIVPTYNSLELLKRTIRSLEEQLPNPSDFQVVVIDDCSTDGTGVWLCEYCGCLKLTPVILLENRGRSAVRNIGVQHASGQLLIFIDGDMEFAPNFIELHKSMHFDDSTVAIGKVVYDRSLDCRGYTRYLEGRGALKFFAGQSVPGRYFLSGCSSLSKTLFEATGGFDEKFDYGEDIDFGLRLADAGGKLIFNPDLVVTHLHTRPLRDTMSTVQEYGRRSIPKLIEKHPELCDDLRLNWLNKNRIARLLRNLIFSRFIYQPVYLFASVFNNLYVPAFIYNYLIYYSYSKGYQQRGENT